MGYNRDLANKVRNALSDFSNVDEKEKMGGLSFMMNDKMCVRVDDDDLMVRCQPEMTETLLKKKGARRFVMKGKPMMKGWLLISPEGTENKEDFDYWMAITLDFNQSSSKKK